MSTMALRQEFMDYVTGLDDESMSLVLAFARTLGKNKNFLSNSKTPQQKIEAAKAFADLEGMSFRIKGETSLDGRSERADGCSRGILPKYDSEASYRTECCQ